MREEHTHADGTVVLSGSAAAVGAAGTPAPAAPTRGLSVRLPFPLPRLRPLVLGGRGGRIALATMLAGTVALVAFASAQQGVLVPRSYLSFPTWEAGPLH